MIKLHRESSKLFSDPPKAIEARTVAPKRLVYVAAKMDEAFEFTPLDIPEHPTPEKKIKGKAGQWLVTGPGGTEVMDEDELQRRFYQVT